MKWWRGLQQQVFDWGLDGWKLDGTADLCRLIRIPGTLNHKFDPPRPVEIIG